jgi:glycosyltransferase involved in cell wall biosynthesis
MRVVQMVCSDGFGGVERYIATLSAGLRAAGVDVEVIGGAAAQMQPVLSAVGVPWHRGDSRREAFAALRALAPPDVLNTHMTEADSLGLAYRLVTRGHGVRHVSTRHFAAPRGGRALTRSAFRVAGRRIHRQLAISDFVAAHVDGPSTIVHSGVADREAAGPRERTVLVAQRLEPEKDTATAVRAWAASDAAARGWTMLVAGDGAEAGALRRLVGDLGVGDSVRFLGFRDDVPALLASAGIVLAPTPREGLGISVLEAMAAGAPVVASAGGGHLETAGAATPEILFPPGDADAAARILDRLVADDGERNRVGERQRERQRTAFTTEAQVAGTLALYREAVRR